MISCNLKKIFYDFLAHELNINETRAAIILANFTEEIQNDLDTQQQHLL